MLAETIVIGLGVWVVGSLLWGGAKKGRAAVKRIRQKKQGWPKRIRR